MDRARDILTSIKVILFSGLKKEWFVWKEQYLARAAYRGYKHILVDDTVEIPADSVVIDERTPPVIGVGCIGLLEPGQDALIQLALVHVLPLVLLLPTKKHTLLEQFMVERRICWNSQV